MTLLTAGQWTEWAFSRRQSCSSALRRFRSRAAASSAGRPGKPVAAAVRALVLHLALVTREACEVHGGAEFQDWLAVGCNSHLAHQHRGSGAGCSALPGTTHRLRRLEASGLARLPRLERLFMGPPWALKGIQPFVAVHRTCLVTVLFARRDW